MAFLSCQVHFCSTFKYHLELCIHTVLDFPNTLSRLMIIILYYWILEFFFLLFLFNKVNSEQTIMHHNYTHSRAHTILLRVSSYWETSCLNPSLKPIKSNDTRLSNRIFTWTLRKRPDLNSEGKRWSQEVVLCGPADPDVDTGRRNNMNNMNNQPHAEGE